MKEMKYRMAAVIMIVLCLIGFLVCAALGANLYVAAILPIVFMNACIIVYFKIKEKIESSEKFLLKNRYKDTIYENRKIKKLADSCKMGDIVAMRDMAYFFRNCCEQSLQELLDLYESNPVQQNEEVIENYLETHAYESRKVTAYMMWLVRAAFYGNENINLLIGNCPYYQRKAHFPYSFYTNEALQSVEIWVSQDIGLIDMIKGEDNGGYLTVCREKGCYKVHYLDSYEPPDETGFGAEWEYDDAYYDEFFCRIPTGDKAEISQKMPILEQERKAYWENPKNHASERKYRRRRYTQEQEVM